ncbi:MULTISPECIES: ABC transporter substrate-binding protein [unclassified Actinopolyspora]|uniref:ABC transporter substrate-binding protein n=1 Tax=unclassified Actinopolyspora TaxID=2639451 RepID=UPI0013F63551|nr:MULTISPECIES: ABC transporter substrate-binding protein [unclassified Actinopolyspora]NHD18620.1 ABC transporter substrate-binding protein [Actinopolyspora sp. BKK2]NHE78058.1 ABC transporter substrate-binding protein [Actinopolyspora sp. BKK1]
MKRLLAPVLVLATAMGMLAGCSDPTESGGDSGGPVVVGSANFSESQLLMEIYAEALRGVGTEVETRGRIGAREVYVKAVRDGEISVIPEYTGNLLRHFDEQATATGAERIDSELRNELPDGLRVLERSAAENSDVLAVTGETADSGLRSMADLGQRCGELVLGAPAEWKPRWKQRISELYGCTFSDIRNLQSGSVRVQALTEGRIQVANLFSTTAAIDRENLVKLDDPKNMYPAQNVLPLVHRGDLNEKQRTALNKVSERLTTEDLTRLNKRMSVDKANPRDLAEEFVSELDL